MLEFAFGFACFSVGFALCAFLYSLAYYVSLKKLQR